MVDTTIELREDILRVRGTCGEALQVQSPREWPLCFVAYDIIVLCMPHMARCNALTGSWALDASERRCFYCDFCNLFASYDSS